MTPHVVPFMLDRAGDDPELLERPSLVRIAAFVALTLLETKDATSRALAEQEVLRAEAETGVAAALLHDAMGVCSMLAPNVAAALDRLATESMVAQLERGLEQFELTLPRPRSTA